jgi:5-methylthioribose kinase
MELDIEDFDALREYLRARGVVQEPGQFRHLRGGVSNRTVRITWADGQDWVLKQALGKLRVKADWFSNPDRILVEARALRWLNRFALPGSTPAFVFEDPANHLMAMQAVPDGHENWKSMLLSGGVRSELFEEFGSLLGSIHARSAECPETCQAFEDTTYFRSLRLEPYYLYTTQQVPAAASFLRKLAEDTLRHKLSMVHGDFSPKKHAGVPRQADLARS